MIDRLKVDEVASLICQLGAKLPLDAAIAITKWMGCIDFAHAMGQSCDKFIEAIAAIQLKVMQARLAKVDLTRRGSSALRGRRIDAFFEALGRVATYNN